MATAWDSTRNYSRGIFVCIHSDPRIGGLKAGEVKKLMGKLYIVENDPEKLIQRYRRDFPLKNNQANPAARFVSFTNHRDCIHMVVNCRVEKIRIIKSWLTEKYSLTNATEKLNPGQYKVAATGFLSLFSVVGIMFYGIPFFFDFWVKDFNWSRATVTSGEYVRENYYWSPIRICCRVVC